MRVRTRTVGSIRRELLIKAKEAALCAIKVFNDPLVTFKSETFIVLMVIAWTYLLHAYYRKQKIDYRYYKQGANRKRYDKTKYGAKKHWELERCLNCDECPVDHITKLNLSFLIQLRHEIEHQMTTELDNYLSGRYQASVLNFNEYLKKLFGEKHGLDHLMTYSIQFVELDIEQVKKRTDTGKTPNRVLKYISEFDKGLTEKEFNDPHFSYRLVFRRKLVNRPGQADKVIEFLGPNDEMSKSVSKEYWVTKEVERKKFRPKDIVSEMQKLSFVRFRISDHTELWQSNDAKNPAKGNGVEVSGQWYWYEPWLKHVLEKCQQSGVRYK
ncbi:MAG: DUF3644 domain-containing protein [Dehalococcoidia bacterium]|nr:DUF3644 domain-containing protein [Dehalococcoidia bacterium]